MILALKFYKDDFILLNTCNLLFFLSPNASLSKYCVTLSIILKGEGTKKIVNVQLNHITANSPNYIFLKLAIHR